MNNLLREVEKLRAQVEALRDGREPPSHDPVALPRASGVVEFWNREYERAHGTPDDGFLRRDAVILHRLAKQFLPTERFAWMIREFHADEDEWLERGGWSVTQLSARARALNLRWVKEVQEPALRREKAALAAELAALAKHPKVEEAISKVTRLRK